MSSSSFTSSYTCSLTNVVNITVHFAQFVQFMRPVEECNKVLHSSAIVRCFESFLFGQLLRKYFNFAPLHLSDSCSYFTNQHMKTLKNINYTFQHKRSTNQLVDWQKMSKRLSRDKALIKRDPQSLITQTAGLINGLDLDDTDPLSAPINNWHAASGPSSKRGDFYILILKEQFRQKFKFSRYVISPMQMERWVTF